MPDLPVALQVATSAGTLTAMWAAGSHRPWAWPLALANQVLWWTLICVQGLWGLAPMAAALTVIYARNVLAERAKRYDGPCYVADPNEWCIAHQTFHRLLAVGQAPSVEQFDQRPDVVS